MSRFFVLPGSAEAQVNSCSVAKCLLIAFYFIGNISAQKTPKSVHVSELQQAKGWTFF